MNIRKVTTALALAGVAATAPAYAVGLTTSSPARPLPEATRVQESSPGLAPGIIASGSTSLPRLAAAEMEATHIATVDAPASGGGAAIGKPLEDIAFVRQATVNGRKEVDSARNALPQLKQPELKRIAAMLVTDHSGANERLSRLAEARSWPVPGPHAPSTPPSGTSAPDFDAAWTAEMIAGHERSAALYRAQAEGGEDQELRKYARQTLPIIERHLTELKRLQK